MHFALRGYLLVALTALLGIAGLWTDDPAFATGWLFPAVLLLGGLAVEAWYAQRTRVELRMHVEGRLKLGRAATAAFVFRHDRGRAQTLQYARALPAAFRQGTEVRQVELPAHEELRDGIELMPLL